MPEPIRPIDVPGLLVGGLPQHEGVSTAPVAADHVSDIRSRVSAAASLAELSNEYAFFTHALFFAYGLMKPAEDPVTHYVNTRAPNLQLLVLDTGVPLLQSFPTYNTYLKTLAQRLYGCPVNDWPALHAYLAGVSGVHRDLRLFWRAGSQQGKLLDVLKASKLTVLTPGGLPTVDVTAYAVGRSDGTYMFNSVPGGYLGVVRGPAQPEIIAAGNALLQTDNHSLLVE